MKTYQVVLTALGARMLKDLKKKRGHDAVRRILDALDDLKIEPAKKTEPLHSQLAGYRSFHTGRYRIVVRIVESEVIVYIVGMGWHESGSRADVYQAVLRAIQSGALGGDN